MNLSFDQIMTGLIIIILSIFFGGVAITSYLDHKHPERKRSLVKYKSEIRRCEIEFPHHPDGKMSIWYGTVNLINCDKGHSVAGATNVEILESPNQ